MGVCKICGLESAFISSRLGVCVNCIRNAPESSLKVTSRAHASSRAEFGLPATPPKNPAGLSCGMCANHCVIGEGEAGFCGATTNRSWVLERKEGLLDYYYDPLPTNCVAWWFCPGCTGAGYPKYAYENGPERGYYNLAVFYKSCTYDCLFCQNWHFRSGSARSHALISPESLAGKAGERTSCICYFGGDPSSQMLHALRTSEIALAKAKEEERKLRVCWETNGNSNPELLKRAAGQSLRSGGVVKFDLKAWTESLSLALCGVSNKSSLQNFETITRQFFEKRPDLPVITASTLLVPGYVDAFEVGEIASFLAGINPRIPYTLLAFYPCFVMDDLPTTSRRQAQECLTAARKPGLSSVRIGNLHLLS